MRPFCDATETAPRETIPRCGDPGLQKPREKTNRIRLSSENGKKSPVTPSVIGTGLAVAAHPRVQLFPKWSDRSGTVRSTVERLFHEAIAIPLDFPQRTENPIQWTTLSTSSTLPNDDAFRGRIRGRRAAEVSVNKSRSAGTPNRKLYRVFKLSKQQRTRMKTLGNFERASGAWALFTRSTEPRRSRTFSPGRGFL